MTDERAIIEKRVYVKLPVSKAFALFTNGMSRWWPLVTHSVGGKDAITVTLDPETHGRIYETTADGTEHLWGAIREWHPHTRLSFTWHPGREPSEEQIVTVTFTPDGSGTLVTLTHTGWDTATDDGRTRYERYDTGWDTVFGERFNTICAELANET